MTPEAKKLLTDYWPLALSLARKCATRNGVDWLADDLASEATAALWRSAVGFEPERGPKFATWARLNITRVLITRLKQERLRNPFAFLSAGPVIDPEDGIPRDRLTTLADERAVQPGDALIADEDAARVRELLRTLPADRAADVIDRVCGRVKYKVLAARRGVTQPRMRQRVEADLLRMRERAVQSGAA